MTSNVKSASLDDETQRIAEEMPNFSEFVREQLREHNRATTMSERERLVAELAEVREDISDLEDQLGEKREEEAAIEARIEEIDEEAEEAVDTVLDHAAEWVAARDERRQHWRNNKGAVGGFSACDLDDAFGDILPNSAREQAEELGVLDDLKNDARILPDGWDRSEVAELTDKQEEAVREWVAENE